jgi:ribosomal protein L15
VQENQSNKKAKGKGHLSKQRKGGNEKKGSWFQDGNKTLFYYFGKSGHQIEKFWTLYSHLCLKQNRKYVKTLARRQAIAQGEVNSLAERLEK